jgi:alanine racemase
MLLAKEPMAEDAENLFSVNGVKEIIGSVRRDTIVQRNSSLYVRGNLKGNLTIESGAEVVIDGSIDGKVTNKGGKLEVRNRGIAEFVMAEGPPEAEAAGVLKIDLSAIAFNWSALQKRTLAECSAVVKADGYGCGIDAISATLGKVGCKTFFVSDLAEAKRVRAGAPSATIYVINGLYPWTAPAFAEINAQPVIGSTPELAEWHNFAASSGWTGGCALSVDTCMERIGISFDEVAAFAGRSYSQAHGVTLLVSHLEKAVKPDLSSYEHQIKQTRELARLYGGISISLAKSAGIFGDPKGHCDIVRPGAAIYGLNPTPGEPNPMIPVVELQARILKVLDLKPGEKIAYNPVWVAKRQTRLAIVGVGYADGFPRPEGALENASKAIVGDKLCSLVGGSSMDMMAIDVTALSDSPSARRGQMVTLIGSQMTVDDLAVAAGTSGREILSKLGHRFQRVHHT